MRRGASGAARPRGWFRMSRDRLLASNGEGAHDRRTLRFLDPELESGFRASLFEQSLGNLRLGHVFGVLMWVVWGLAIHQFLPFGSDRMLDTVVRYGIFIPILLGGLAVSFTRWYERFWEWEIGVVLSLSMIAWVIYVAQIRVMPPDYGYVGLILMLVMTYTLLRMRFLAVMVLNAVAIVAYVPVAILADQIAGLKTMLAVFYLLTFAFLGMVVARRQERFARLLYLRERQLERERERSDTLLLNILPEPVVDRLKARALTGESRHLAEVLDDVTVLFADAVGFTHEATRTPPEALVETLDRLFSRFDELAERFHLEKIKTVGDAYMAVAGAPVPRPDHVHAAAGMALAIVEEVEERWPSGEPIRVRIGIATGPVVAGVIGTRKFAYDLWGDTVNLASRLESNGVPGRVQISEETARRLEREFACEEPHVVELKGKGPTLARFLVGRRSEARRSSSATADSA